MAEEQVGGISVSFTADAAQLQQQIQRLETQLKQFDAAYGRQKVQLQVATPSNRQLLDTRREISQAFTARGSAGQIMAKVHVQPPDARALGQFRSQLKSDIGEVPIKVIGNFEWGQRPPQSITIPVTGGGGGGGRAGGSSAAPTGGQPTPLAGQRPVQPKAAAPTPGVGNVTTAGSQAVQRTRSTRPASTRVTKEDLAATWTQDDLTSMSTAVLRDEMRGLKGAEKKLFQDEIDRRDIAAVSRAGQRPTARGLAGGGIPASAVKPARQTFQLAGPPSGATAKRITPEMAAKRYMQWFALASPQEIKEGMEWYDKEMGELLSSVKGTGWSPRQTELITAAFSRNNAWSQNKTAVGKFAQRWKAGARTPEAFGRQGDVPGVGMSSSIKDALAVALGNTEAMAAHPKEDPFSRALGGDPSAVAIDRWMSVMQGFEVPGKAIPVLQQGITLAAQQAGIQPRQMQAVPWVVARNRMGNVKKDRSITEREGMEGQVGPGMLSPLVGAAVAPGPAAGRPTARGLTGQFDPNVRAIMPGDPGFEAQQAAQYAAIHGPLQPQARGLSQAQLEQRRAAGRSSYAKLVAEGRAGPGIRGILPRGFPIRQQPRMPMAADLPWDEEGNLGGVGASEYGYASPAYGLMSEEEARLDAPVAGGKRPPRGKQIPGGFQRRAKVSPAARAETIQFDANLQAAQAAQEQFQERQIRTARASSIRSVPTFLAGLLSGGLGGVRAQEQSKQATVAVNAHKAAVRSLTDAQTEENEIAKKMDAEKPGSAAHKFLTGSLEETRLKVKELTAAEKDLRIQADDMTASANKAAGSGLRNLAAGFVSNLTAGLAFGAGFAALGGIIEGVGQGLAPTIARMTNFSEVAGETSKNLAALTRAAGGRPEVGVAQAFAQAGFKGPVAEQLRPELQQIAEIQAGLAAFKEQQALIQTAFNFRNAQGIPGITTSTGGGPFGIGAEKGLFETIKEQLGTLPAAQRGPGAVVGKGAVLPGEISSVPELTETQAKSLELVNQQLDLFGVSLRQATDEEIKAGAVARQAGLVSGIGGPQATQLAATLGGKGLVLQNEQGQLLTGDQLETAVTEGLAGASKQSAKDIVNGMRPMIEAQRALFRLQSDFQRDQLNPAQFALQMAANPLTRQGGFGERPTNALTGRQIPIPAIFRGAFNQPGGGGAVGAQFTAAFESLAPMIDQTDQRLSELRQEGQRALEALVPADQIVQFRALNREISQVGAQIAGLQIGAQQEQVNLQVAQYNNQLRIASRSQTDLLQLTGQMGATQGDNLGLLQRQQIMYERQTQELSLQSNELTLQSNTLSIILAQRQINFQRSLAGFVTPGETPQEIAARAKEAELEANFAQKQLDIQKEQLKIAREQQGIAGEALPLQFKIQDIGFQRQLTDINAEIALLNQGIQVVVHTAAAERAIAHLTALENELVKRAGTYVEEGAKVAGAFMEGVAQVKAATVDSMETVIRETARAWNIFIQQGQYAVGALSNGARGLPPPASGGGGDETYGGPKESFDAPGYLGTITGATRITVGEAGPETVAVIRNPRSWTPTAPASGSWGGGGGTAPINIMVTGNTIGGSEQDQERFAAIIARKVEEIQSRRGSLLGLRSV